MNGFDVELVGKIGSMALIERKSNRLNYSRIAALATSSGRAISG